MALQGAGTELDPFLVTKLAELRTEVTNAAAYYKVTQNLDVRGTQYEAEWLECTLACLQLDFDNKELKNVTTAQNNHLFRFNCTTVTIKNLKLVNHVNNKALFAHATTNYDALTNLTILNSSFSVKWYANIIGFNSTDAKGIIGTKYASIDNCNFNLELHGTTLNILHSDHNVNRCHFALTGNIELKQNPDSSRRMYCLLKLELICTKIYLTGNLSVTCSGTPLPFYVILNTYNSDYWEYDDRAYYAQCYCAVTFNITVPRGTDHVFDFWRYQTSDQAPPSSFMCVGDMIVNGGILTSLPSAKARVYLLTREQARDADYLSGIGFDVSEVV